MKTNTTLMTNKKMCCCGMCCMDKYVFSYD